MMMMIRPHHKRPVALARLALGLALVCALSGAHTARASCPFDDTSCQDYCGQQGCSFGYCGHFAWVQCICRKCGDEWNWYDKVHYNPDKQVNQTELASLELAVRAPAVLSAAGGAQQARPSDARPSGPQQAQTPVQPQPQTQPQTQQPTQRPQKPASGAQESSGAGKQQQAPATLTTLLIPDLSDGSKLDLNDIPDENSDKFLDYLAKNHEKLAQATNAAPVPARADDDESGAGAGGDDDDDDESSAGHDRQSQTDEPTAEETVEIQISSSNNQPQQQQVAGDVKRQQLANLPAGVGGDADQDEQGGEAAATTTTAEREREKEKEKERERQRREQQTGGSPVTRLLRMAVAERSSDDIL